MRCRCREAHHPLHSASRQRPLTQVRFRIIHPTIRHAGQPAGPRFTSPPRAAGDFSVRPLGLASERERRPPAPIFPRPLGGRTAEQYSRWHFAKDDHHAAATQARKRGESGTPNGGFGRILTATLPEPRGGRRRMSLAAHALTRRLQHIPPLTLDGIDAGTSARPGWRLGRETKRNKTGVAILSRNPLGIEGSASRSGPDKLDRPAEASPSQSQHSFERHRHTRPYHDHALGGLRRMIALPGSHQDC